MKVKVGTVSLRSDTPVSRSMAVSEPSGRLRTRNVLLVRNRRSGPLHSSGDGVAPLNCWESGGLPSSMSARAPCVVRRYSPCQLFGSQRVTFQRFAPVSARTPEANS
jgi:hypothetical protein